MWTNIMEDVIKVFIAYSRQDFDLLTELRSHIKILERAHKIKAWHDGEIEAGHEWEIEIKKALHSADIILLLISKDFLASDYCYEKEMSEALELHKSGKKIVLPVILKTCAWESAPFAKFQVLPKSGAPIVSPKWHTRDEAFKEVVEALKYNSERIRIGIALKDPEKAYEYYLSQGDDFFLDMDWLNAKKFYQKALQRWSDTYFPNKNIIKEKIEFCGDANDFAEIKSRDVRNLVLYAYKDENSGLYGFYNPKNNRIIIPAQFDEVYTTGEFGANYGMTSDGMACVSLNGKIGAIDIIGNDIAPFIFDEAKEHICDILEFRKGNCWGAIDRFGNDIIPFIFDWTEVWPPYVVVAKNGKQGIYTTQGTLVLPIEYDDIVYFDGEVFQNDLAVVQKNNRYGFVNEKNEVIIPFNYKMAHGFSEDFAAVQNFDDLWGFINGNSETVINFKYDAVEDFDNNMARVKIDELWGIIDRDGKFILRCKYEEIGWYCQEFVPLKNGGLWGGINLKSRDFIDFNLIEWDPILKD